MTVKLKTNNLQPGVMLASLSPPWPVSGVVSRPVTTDVVTALPCPSTQGRLLSLGCQQSKYKQIKAYFLCQYKSIGL